MTDDELPPLPEPAWRPAMPHMPYSEAQMHAYARAAIAADRERCKQAIRDTRDRSGVNDDGQSWLMRAGRSDFIAAIDALGLPDPRQPTGEAK